MKRPENLKIGDKFVVSDHTPNYDIGEIIKLIEDDNTECPKFENSAEVKSYASFEALSPCQVSESTQYNTCMEDVVISVASACAKSLGIDFDSIDIKYIKNTKDSNNKFVPYLEYNGQRIGEIGKYLGFEDALGNCIHIGDIVSVYLDCNYVYDSVISLIYMHKVSLNHDILTSNGKSMVILSKSYNDTNNGEVINGIKYVKSI